MTSTSQMDVFESTL